MKDSLNSERPPTLTSSKVSRNGKIFESNHVVLGSKGNWNRFSLNSDRLREGPRELDFFGGS